MQNDKILKDAAKVISDLTKKLEIEKAKAAERSGMSEEDRQGLLTAVAKDILRVLQPLLSKIAENSKVNGADIQKAIEAANINVTVQQDRPEVTVNVPAIKLPDFPKIPTPVVNYRPPDIHIPDIQMPDEMEIKGWINLMGYDKGLLLNPLPVQIRDAQGNPLNINALIAALKGSSPGGGGVGSGKTDYFTLKALLDGSGNPYGSANPFPVTITSGATATTASNIVDSSGIPYTGSNPVPTYQASAPTFSSAAAIVDSAGNQYSGSNPMPVTVVVAAGATSAVAIVDSSGQEYEGSNPLPVYLAQGSNNSSAVQIVDSSGVPFEGANPFPVTLISGALTSSISVGPSASGAADDGSDPVQTGGLARTTNPSKLSDGQVVKSSYDVVGRQLIRPLQVRGLMATAYVQISTGTETTLRAGVAGVYLDLVYILASNNSDAAVSVDIRQVTAGGVVMTLQVPANGVAGVSLPVPIPQQDTGNNWTADLPDITGTTISFSALFSQEV